MGLLNYLTAHSLDEDYEQVSRTRVARGEPGAQRSGAAVLAVLAVFGLLVATAALQDTRNASVAQEAHVSLVKQVNERSTQLDTRRATASDLRTEIDTLQKQYLQNTAAGRSLQTQLGRLDVLSGAVAVHGPGVKVVVDDAPGATKDPQRVQDKDLQRLVNGLWQAGGEAISINGHRLSALSAIRQAGGAITVNLVSLVRPYTVSVIGNPKQIPARFTETSGGSYWVDVQSLYGLQFSMTSEESLKLPAAKRLALRFAHRPEVRR